MGYMLENSDGGRYLMFIFSYYIVTCGRIFMYLYVCIIYIYMLVWMNCSIERVGGKCW